MERIRGACRSACLLAGKLSLGFLAVNVVFWAAFELNDAVERTRVGRARGLLRYRKELLDRACAGMTRAQYTELLVETRSRPFMCNAYTHFLESPFAGKFGNVHAAGFRLNRGRAAWPPEPGNEVVFVFGGSTTFGYGVADWETIPSYLDDELKARLPSRDPLVYNFGQGAFYSSQELALLVNLLRSNHRPTTAVFIDGLNEFAHPCDVPEHMGLCSDSAPPACLELPLVRAFRVARHRVGSHTAAEKDRSERAGAGKFVPSPGTSTVVVDRWADNVRMVRAIAEEYGIRTLFVWQPVPSYHYDLRYHLFADAIEPAMSQCLGEGYSEMDRRRRDWGDRGDFLYLGDIQESRREGLYVDRVHYTAGFCRDIAKLIADSLVPALDGARDDRPGPAPPS